MVKELIGFVDGQTTNPSLIAKNPDIIRLVRAGHKLTEEQEAQLRARDEEIAHLKERVAETEAERQRTAAMLRSVLQSADGQEPTCAFTGRTASELLISRVAESTLEELQS